MKNTKSPRPLWYLALPFAAWVAVAAPFNAAAQEKPAAAKQAESDSALPTAKEVIAKFVRAIGGKEAFAKIESQHAKGKFEMAAQGVKGDLEVFAKRPNQLLVKVAIPGIGDVTSGFDGKVAWALNATTGPMLMEGKQLEQMREQADFDSVLHNESDFKSMTVAGKEEFDGKECYKLKLVKKSGQEATEFYDVKTGLLVGSIAKQETPFGEVEVTNSLGEYKLFNGVQFATKIVQKMGPIEQAMTIDTFELNKVEDSAFALPDEIKTLTQKKE